MRKTSQKRRRAGKSAARSRTRTKAPGPVTRQKADAAQASQAAGEITRASRELFARARALDQQADLVHHGIETVHERARALHDQGPPAAPGTESGDIVVDDKLGHEGKPFPIVGIGASAGGYEAFAEFLRELPRETGMAFVLVLHLDPKHKSQVSELLGRSSRIPVLRAGNEMEVKPDHLYVIPENSTMTIAQGKLRLYPRKEHEAPPMTIDLFFRSLAQEQQTRAIGVVLSGTGCDGTLGIEAIKGEGGITFAQDDRSSKFHDMPGNAIASGSVDFVLPPANIARELSQLAKHPLVIQKKATAPGAGESGELERLLRESPNDIGILFRLLRARTGVDFSLYKQSTLRRRIIRRMILHKKDSLPAYVRLAESSPIELDSLFDDLLINVTSFFRDPKAFQVLKKKVFPRLVKAHKDDAPLRIWVCGCSTGEEAYSLAMALVEFFDKAHTHRHAQIFATDISEVGISKARAGIYPPNIQQDVSPERLRRFFTKVNGNFQVNKAIRDMVIFARQNVLLDPPFSNLDLVSCRNVLIYFGPVLQRKVVPLFHYSLRDPGFLLLGNSESIGAGAEHFQLVDRKHKLYARKHTYPRVGLEAPPKLSQAERKPLQPSMESPEVKTFDFQQYVDRLLLRDFTPATIVVNSAMDAIYFRGRTGLYVEHASGTANLNLFKMLREGLSVNVRAALGKATREDAPVKHAGMEYRRNGHLYELTIEVIPFRIAPLEERFYVVLFRENPNPVPVAQAHGQETASSSAGRLRRDLDRARTELMATKESMQSIIEEQEATNEELKSANEEIQSSNEELETAKEELQSTNEELTTLNEELQTRNTELGQLNNDLQNFLISVNVPILMVDQDLTIRRFTPMAERLFDLLPVDVGRRLSSLKRTLLPPDLDQTIRHVIEDLSVVERETQDGDGRGYLLRIRPYRTRDNKIEGAVIVLVDADELRRALDLVMSMVEQPLLMLDGSLRVRSANEAFLEAFGLESDEVLRQPFYEIGGRQWDRPELRTLLEDILPKNNRVKDYTFDAHLPKVGIRKLRLSASRFLQGDKGFPLILVAMKEE